VGGMCMQPVGVTAMKVNAVLIAMQVYAKARGPRR
jgi:hypothetical protein